MKRITTLLTLMLLAGVSVFGQSRHMATEAQIGQRATVDVKLKQLNHDQSPMLTAKTITPQNNNQVTPAGVQTVSPVELGRASNAFTILRMEQNQIFASDDLNAVGFIHRQDVTIYGGGTAENGKLRYDLSTDGGATFTDDIGVLNSTFTRPSRYPNLTLYNTAGNSNPFNANLIYSAPTLATSWDGHVVGVSDINTSGATATESYLFNGDRAYLPGGLTEGLPGEFWTVDREYIDPNLLDSVFVYKGTWNSATSDVDWVRFAAIAAGTETSFGSSPIVGPNISFSPDGMTGYVSWLGDLAGQGAGLGNLSPVFMQTTDGGATWGAPVEVDLDQISWIGDTLRSFWINVDSLTGDTIPAGTGKSTTGFDFDITVDDGGTCHLGVVIGNGLDSTGGNAYSISSGLVKFIADIQWDGTSVDVAYISSCLTFRGEFGTPDPTSGDLITFDNAVQVARDEAGERIFFHWVDSDTSLIGFGEANNIAPNGRFAGLRVADGFQTPVIQLTDGDFIHDGKCYTPVMAQTVLTSGTDYSLPIVFLDMITNNQLEPCKFWYLGNDAKINDGCFDMVSNLDLTADGQILIDNLPPNCATGIEEEIAANGLKHMIFPNPAANNATIRFELPFAAEVQYNLVDMMGKEVISSTGAQFGAGMHDIDMNTAGLAPGIYFYSLQVADQVFSNKLVINR